MTEQPGRKRRRRPLRRDQRGRKVPGREGGDDADGLMADFETSSRHAALDDPAIDAARLFGVPAELIDSQAPFALRLRDRLAGLAGDHSRRFARAPNHLVGDRVHGVGPREGRSCPPRLKTGLGGVERFFRVGDAGDRRLAQRGLGHRADHSRLGSVRGLPPFASNEKSKSFVHLSQPPKPSRRGLPRSTSAPLLRAPGLAVRLRSQQPGADAFRQLRRKRRSPRQTPLGSAR